MTIYALSSGPGISGVSIIRVSGADTAKVIKTLTGKEVPSPRKATLRKINNINTSELIDEGIIIWFPGPESYTGEDMAEFHVHGGKAVVLAVQEAISNIENCRLAEAGEFTKLAFQNGKINLLKAESIADLISAETEIQRKQAIKIMNGNSSEKFNQLRVKLLKILSFVEAKIDFPEEDLPDDNLERIKKDSLSVLNEINKILDDQKVGEIIRNGFKIAIVGPTNAGKSSLLNNLSNREVAIVSEIAGTTRDVVETYLNIDGYPVIISDTAGIRDSKDEIEKKGIKLSLSKAENADLKLVVVDAKNMNLSGFLTDLLKKDAILVVNKSDLIKETLDKEISKFNHVLISLKDNLNIDKLIEKIKGQLKNKFISEEDILITRERHRQHLVQCIDYLKHFLEKNNKKDFDKAAEDLRLATRHLGMIVGKVDVEEILGSIFNDFCIGK
ncbi:tRNA uridine-5-carboxymethylaminomethyl(34) synthesis GTPase MnmE [Candidatus Pelagibacter sp.]|nr:tRNA uridine-5-carboxymethylaminomethyl(34) synthesis GTPase MnmE [Candidatus Pelagibacter sp.]